MGPAFRYIYPAYLAGCVVTDRSIAPGAKILHVRADTDIAVRTSVAAADVRGSHFTFRKTTVQLHQIFIASVIEAAN